MTLSTGGNPFGAGFDPEDILKSFFGGRSGPFGAAGTGFDEFGQVQQVSCDPYSEIKNTRNLE